jgi:hypothetical protein
VNPAVFEPHFEWNPDHPMAGDVFLNLYGSRAELGWIGVTDLPPRFLKQCSVHHVPSPAEEHPWVAVANPDYHTWNVLSENKAAVTLVIVDDMNLSWPEEPEWPDPDAETGQLSSKQEAAHKAAMQQYSAGLGKAYADYTEKIASILRSSHASSKSSVLSTVFISHGDAPLKTLVDKASAGVSMEFYRRAEEEHKQWKRATARAKKDSAKLIQAMGSEESQAEPDPEEEQEGLDAMQCRIFQVWPVKLHDRLAGVRLRLDGRSAPSRQEKREFEVVMVASVLKPRNHVTKATGVPVAVFSWSKSRASVYDEALAEDSDFFVRRNDTSLNLLAAPALPFVKFLEAAKDTSFDPMAITLPSHPVKGELPTVFYQHLLNCLTVNGDSVLYVGDHPQRMLAAAAYDMPLPSSLFHVKDPSCTAKCFPSGGRDLYFTAESGSIGAEVIHCVSDSQWAKQEDSTPFGQPPGPPKMPVDHDDLRSPVYDLVAYSESDDPLTDIKMRLQILDIPDLAYDESSLRGRKSAKKPEHMGSETVTESDSDSEAEPGSSAGAAQRSSAAAAQTPAKEPSKQKKAVDGPGSSPSAARTPAKERRKKKAEGAPGSPSREPEAAHATPGPSITPGKRRKSDAALNLSAGLKGPGRDGHGASEVPAATAKEGAQDVAALTQPPERKAAQRANAQMQHASAKGGGAVASPSTKRPLGRAARRGAAAHEHPLQQRTPPAAANTPNYRATSEEESGDEGTHSNQKPPGGGGTKPRLRKKAK